MKNFILYIIFAITTVVATAQAPVDNANLNPKKEEKIQALYIAYISQKLSLTPAEAEKFWPAHIQYDAELRAINKDNLSELDRQQSTLNVKKKYQASFNKILGNERSNNFYKQDGEFRKKLVDRLKQMRQQQHQNENNNNGARMQRGGRGRP